MVLACVACATCVALAGCGDAASKAPTYAAAGNAICADEAAHLAGLHRPATIEQAVAYLPPALAILRSETSRLQALHASGSSSAKLAAALASARALAALLARLRRQLRHGMVEFSELAVVQSRAAALQAQIAARFREAGLPRCAIGRRSAD